MKLLRPLCLALLLTAACNGDNSDDGPEPDPATAAPAPAPASAGTTVAGAASTASGARSVAEETDNFVFDYSYPAEAGDLPGIAALLDRRLERSREQIARQATVARKERRDAGFPFNKFSRSMEWKVVANLPGWISLSGEWSTYEGGAHGMYGVESLVWNKRTDEAGKGIDLFTSPRALGEALGARYCDALNAERVKKGSPALQEDSESVFPACPSMEELTVLVGSSDGRTFDRLTLYAGPYIAGAYAEGAYEVDLDVDDAVLEVVKPEYRKSFSKRR